MPDHRHDSTNTVALFNGRSGECLNATNGHQVVDPLKRKQRTDLLFLTVIVVVSVLPYVWRLGFYSDDWASLGMMTTVSDQSVAGLVKEQLASDPDGRARLTNIVYQALLFRVFALNPLGYHIVNSLVLVSAALLVYLVLIELSAHRTVALSTAAVYILLPNYSTDRFWFIAFAYCLSMVLLLAGTYALLRAARSQWLLAWTAFGLFALSAAALGMEVVVPLIPAIPAAIVWQVYRPGGVRLPSPRACLLLISPLAVTLVVTMYKSQTARGFRVPDFLYFKQLGLGAIVVNFGTYGIALLDTVAWSCRHLPLGGAAVGGLLGVIIFSYLLRDEPPRESQRSWTTLVLIGSVVFGLGTAIFLIAARITFSSTGIANRVWIAAALGVALVLVGASGWATSRLPSGPRRWSFSALITGFCLSGFSVNTTLATYWIAAWPRQLEVMRNIQQALPELASGSTVILDGVCPYLGPAIVFESSWDLAGALRGTYQDRSLRADVTTSQLSIDDDGLRTRIYSVSQFYPYGRDLLIFDDRRRTVVQVTDRNVARAYLSDQVRCPEGNPGQGTLALPLDVWYTNVTTKGFHPWR